MDSLQAQITDEIARIVPIIEELTGLPSRWSGAVEVVPFTDFFGKKLFSCSIQIADTVTGSEARWRTLIHELLHSVSAGYNTFDYNRYQGWEEGVVEKLQRLFRPVILARLGVAVASEVFAPQEDGHLFNRRIKAVEQLRQMLLVEPEEFYLNLLRMPVRDRPGFVLSAGRLLNGPEYHEFVRAFSVSNAILSKR